MGLKMHCTVPGCQYETEEVTESNAAIQLLTLHMTHIHPTNMVTPQSTAIQLAEEQETAQPVGDKTTRGSQNISTGAIYPDLAGVDKQQDPVSVDRAEHAAYDVAGTTKHDLKGHGVEGSSEIQPLPTVGNIEMSSSAAAADSRLADELGLQGNKMETLNKLEKEEDPSDCVHFFTLINVLHFLVGMGLLILTICFFSNYDASSYYKPGNMTFLAVGCASLFLLLAMVPLVLRRIRLHHPDPFMWPISYIC